jgi:pantetheine-phosphate adenylyltransferase
MKSAVFSGSFDPFTKGHKSIIDRALPLFDKIFIAIGSNVDKSEFLTIDNRKEIIKTLYGNNDKIIIDSYSGLTIDYCKKVNADFILRGVRNTTDLEYEKTMAQANKTMLSNIETVFLLTEPKYTHISSSIVRDIIKHNGDVSQFMPKNINIYKILQNQEK